MDCITFTGNGDEADLRTPEGAGTNPSQDLYVSGALKTGRVMVKDEDVCLHCGLCAERCPTGAWDMQKFLLNTTQAGPACRDAATAAWSRRALHEPHRSGQRLRHQVRQRQRLGLGLGQRAVRQGHPAHGRAGQPAQHLPSNIQGLPTWYEVRACGAGWLGRRGGIDMMVAMNLQTWDADVAELEPGGYLFYDSTRPMPIPQSSATTSHVIGMPLTEICNGLGSDPRQRQLFKNIMAMSARCRCCWKSEPEVFSEKLFGEQYKGRLLAFSNVQALHLGRFFAREHLTHPLPSGLRRADRAWASASLSMATAPPRRWGCVHGGATVAAWYPDHAVVVGGRGVQKYCSKRRVDATGQNRYAIVQAGTRSPPSAWWWAWLERRAGFHRHLGPGRVADDRVHRPGLLCRDSGDHHHTCSAGLSTGMPTRTQQA